MQMLKSSLSAGRIGFLIAAMFGLSSASQGFAAEFCAEWVPPPQQDAKPASPASKPTKFNPVHGEGKSPALDFVGDSLTAGNGVRFPRSTAQQSVGRAYEVYAIGGQNSATLANLFDAVSIGGEDVGIIWVGRNNAPIGSGALNDAEQIARRFTSGNYIVLGILPGRYKSDQPGQPNRAHLDQANAELRHRFGKRFVDVTGLLTCDDYNDNIHLTDAGYDKVARAVSARIEQLGF